MDPILKYNLLSKSMDNDGEKKKIRHASAYVIWFQNFN